MPQDPAPDQLFPLGDEPIETLAQDGLAWKHYVFALLRRVEAADTPFVLGVFGGWGSGKTSFLNILGDAAQKPEWPPPGGGQPRGHKYDWRVIRVNPWECDTPEDAKRLLASSLWRDFFNRSKWLSRERLRALGRTREAAAAAALDTAGSAAQLSDLGQAAQALFSSDASIGQQLRKHFEEDLKLAVRGRGDRKRRLLVLIDDLDRCRRDVIPEVLETIKLYLNQKGCVFVLAADPAAVADAVQDLYKPPEGQPRRITGTDYLEKIVQLPFYLPRLDEERTQGFFARCKHFLYEERMIDDDVCALLLEHIFQGNPRAMKRFCMTHGLIAEIAPVELDADKLATVLGLQMRFPAVFKACSIAPSLLYRTQEEALAADREPAAPEADDDEQPAATLAPEFGRFFPPEEVEAHARAAQDPRLQAFLAAAPKFESEDEPEQYFSYAVVARREEPGAPEGLDAALEMLRSDDPEERAQAARALGEIGHARAVEPLIAALSDDIGPVRGWAAVALGQIGDPRAVQPLIAALGDKDAHVANYAASALGGIGEPAVGPLITALGHDDAKVRTGASWALARIGEPAIDPLITALSDDRGEVRESATLAIGLMGDPGLFSHLVGKLGDDDSKVLRAAIWGLFNLREAAVDPVMAALDNDDPSIRRGAAIVLGQIGAAAERALPRLRGLADHDPESDVRDTASEAVRNIEQVLRSEELPPAPT